MNASESPLAVGSKLTRGLDLRACATTYGNGATSACVVAPPIAMICLVEVMRISLPLAYSDARDGL